MESPIEEDSEVAGCDNNRSAIEQQKLRRSASIHVCK